MTPTIRCPRCRVVLNVPAEAGNRRLKCPSCGTKFHASGPLSGSPGVATAGPSSSEVTNCSSDYDIIPKSPKDLRETFDLPLLGEDPSDGGVPAGLFREERPAARRPSPAEARLESRYCPSCSSVVPRGMSLCEHCGLDLDTGEYVEVDPELEEEELPVAPRRPTTPIGVFVIGITAALVSVVLCILSLVMLGEGIGGILLALVSLFGVYGAVQFLRGKSVQPLIVALAIAGGVDIVGLIVLPVVQANEHVANAPLDEMAVDEEGSPIIPRFVDRLDVSKIQWGIALLVIDAAAMIYLSTGGVRRHFTRELPPEAGPISL